MRPVVKAKVQFLYHQFCTRKILVVFCTRKFSPKIVQYQPFCTSKTRELIVASNFAPAQNFRKTEKTARTCHAVEVAADGACACARAARGCCSALRMHGRACACSARCSAHDSDLLLQNDYPNEPKSEIVATSVRKVLDMADGEGPSAEITEMLTSDGAKAASDADTTIERANGAAGGLSPEEQVAAEEFAS